MKQEKLFTLILRGLLFALFAFSTVASADTLYFVDAHSQVDHKVKDINIVLKRMRENGVRTTILASRGRREARDIVLLARRSGGKVVASIRTKGGKYTKNKSQYYKKLEKQSSNGNFGAIAEVLMFHARKGNKADEVDIMPNDKRVQAALKAAQENGWPFVAHIEFASLRGSKRERYMKAFESMLTRNPSTPILLIHMGQLQPGEAEALLKAHENFFLLTSHADRFTTETSSQPWVNMFKGQKFKPEWKSLIQRYPGHFVFALDNVWAEHWQSGYAAKVKLWREALGGLDPAVAAKVAHENAERLYSLN